MTPEQRLDGDYPPAEPAEPAKPAGDRQALLSALVTEHFVLQSGRSTLTGESGSRSSLYLAVLSSTLVATGFLGSADQALKPFLGCVLPVVIGLGLLTWARLVELNVEDLRYLRGMQTIRRYYASLTPDAAAFFPDLNTGGDLNAVAAVFSYMGQRPGRRQLLFTAAATVAAVNSAVAGIAAALLSVQVGSRTLVAVAVGLSLFTIAYLLSLQAQWRSNVRAFAT